MHTVEILERSIAIAERLGYRIRQEWLGGNGGGACEFSGQKWIFIDLALNTVEQLDQVTEALLADPALHLMDLPAPMQQHFGLREAA